MNEPRYIQEDLDREKAKVVTDLKAPGPCGKQGHLVANLQWRRDPGMCDEPICTICASEAAREKRLRGLVETWPHEFTGFTDEDGCVQEREHDRECRRCLILAALSADGPGGGK